MDIIEFLRNSIDFASVFQFLIGFLGVYLFDNFIKTKKDRALAFQVLQRGEKLLPEGTKADDALDIFIHQYKEKHGKAPSAGALKTFNDLKMQNKNVDFEVKPGGTKKQQNTG